MGFLSDTWDKTKDAGRAAFDVTANVVTGGQYGIYDAQRDAEKAQKRAQDQARRDAEAMRLSAERAFNAQNKKKPNIAALMQANAAAGLAGNSGTMLTGPQGVTPDALLLGRSSLLGL